MNSSLSAKSLFSILSMSCASLLGFSAFADTSACDFVGDYSKTCVKKLESTREGGVVLIWSPGQEFSCAQLKDTAMLATHEYCTSLSGTPRTSKSTPSTGGVPFTCDGVTGTSYASDRDSAFTDLLNDRTETLTTSGFPDVPENATVAYSKFVCSAN